jgi:aminomethyltransferase
MWSFAEALGLFSPEKGCSLFYNVVQSLMTSILAVSESVLPEAPLRSTPLHAQHVGLGARVVPFAGYAMPVQYPTGILTEHLWTRAHAGLFDVSHMGQAFLVGPDWTSVARALEALVPTDVAGLKANQQRYTQLLSSEGGILDDLMVTRPSLDENEGRLYLVVNAGTKEADYAYIRDHLPEGITLDVREDLALLALQGPDAEAVLQIFEPELAHLPFMFSRTVLIEGVSCHVSRSGYTGEDGFEISIPASEVSRIWERLLQDERVKPIGLGARDSLRLEAGLCLYGHDMDAHTSPVEAALTWSIPKSRRVQGGFHGASRIQNEIAQGPSRVRVGLLLEGKAPAREGAIITSRDGQEIGIVTSGGFGPSVNAPIAMGYVPPAFASHGTCVHLVVRGKPLLAHVVSLPFIPSRFKRS